MAQPVMMVKKDAIIHVYIISMGPPNGTDVEKVMAMDGLHARAHA